MSTSHRLLSLPALSLLSLSVPFAPAHGAETAGTSAPSIMTSPSKPVARSPDAQRISEIAALLSADKTSPGRPIEDRAAWNRVREYAAAKVFLAAAERDLTEPTPELTRELFYLFKTKGTRPEYERPFFKRAARLAHFTLAECMENEGRLLAAIETELAAILAEETWVAPAHWFGHGAERGVEVVDLASTARAWTLAVVDHWLGAKLKPETRAAIRREVEVRVWRPYLKAIRTLKTDKGNEWIKYSSNWNAVCHAGVIGSALALIDSPEERAEFIAGGEVFLPFFLNGFSRDGYCSEGVAYWNYGFGNYLYLADLVRRATDGRLDWLQDPLIQAIATYPLHLEIFDGIFPTYADGVPGGKPALWMKDYLERRLSLGRPDWRQSEPDSTPIYTSIAPVLCGIATNFFIDRDDASSAQQNNADSTKAAPLRDEFPEAQVFTLRPAPGDPRFGVSFKGGHNEEEHNHNDLGSYVVAVGARTPLLDAGMEVYTSKTFGPHRYESRVIGSYGHPVPLVAGKVQANGRHYTASVLSRAYSDTEDQVTLDLAGAYVVPTLEKLERTFTYQRGENPSFTVRDVARFSKAEAFGTALITFSQVKQTAPDRLLVYDNDSAVEVRIDAGGAAFRITDEILPETLPRGNKARRIGIDLETPATEATITATITPAAVPAGD